MSALNTLKKVLFLDIETIAGHSSFEFLDERKQNLWKKKAHLLEESSDPQELYQRKAGIYAEFGKVICMVAGRFSINEDATVSLRLKTLTETDEPTLLKNISIFLDGFPKDFYLCAHNGKEFDFPYLCRRMLVNNIPLPNPLKLSNKKPWEVRHYDTLEMWKFGDRKAFTSLEMLAALFDIPTSKDEMDGSEVNTIFYKEKNIEKIASYCRKDVIVTAKLFLKLQGFGNLEVKEILEF